MQHYLDEAPCLAFAFTDEGRITAANNTLCRTTGYQHSEVVGSNISRLVSLGTRIFFQTHLFPLLRLEGHAEEIFITVRCKDGSDLPVMMNVKQVEGGTELIVVGIVIVNRNKYEEGIIAAKKYAEAALAENKDLQQAKAQALQHAAQLDEQLGLLQQQNENLSGVAWTLTHTMQEPLRKISLFTSKLLATTPVDTTPLLQKINAASVMLQQQFVALQRYVQMEWREEELQPVALQLLFANAAQPFVEEGHAIALRLQNCPAVYAQPALLQTLAHELFSNAIKFRKPSTQAQVVVTGTVVQANAFRQMKEKYQYANYLKVSFTDAGIGFAPQHRERLFQLFTRLTPRADGLGMGLAFCKKIMELHRGFMLAETSDAIKTVFSCFFPMQDGRSNTG